MKGVFTNIFTLLLAGCSSTPSVERLLETQEGELKTGGSTTMLFHSSLYYPSEISLSFPGYIVGIEKSPVHTISSGEQVKSKEHPNSGFDETKLLEDPKIMYVSHIIETYGKPYGEGNCALYNAYYRENNKTPKPPTEYCPDVEKLEVPPKDAFNSSWKAMDVLSRRINTNISNYTHVIVLTMGWNTVQEEAVRNFNSIGKNLKFAANDEEFKPLFIGVTWPSQWMSDWLEPVIKIASFPIKAKDADEVGLTWLGVLLHETLADITIPVVVIGHSFGARATSVATCLGPAIANPNPETKTKNKVINYLINLQAAYRSSRLIPPHKEGKLRYYDGCKNAENIILTSSINDKAMDTLFWRKDYYMGDDKGYDKYCGEEQKKLNCGIAKPDGHYELINKTTSNITYINSDKLINKNSYLSGGDAHSDIYREEHGVLLWDILSK